MPLLSVAIITRDEAPRIARCIASVAFADEIVVLDSGSSDDTVAIARAAGARVEIASDWRGFGVQKNRVLERCSGDWILGLDADETVTPTLAAAIQAALAQPAACWGARRVSTFLGHEIRWGDWRGDVVWRLFPRGQARYSERLVHEDLVTTLPRRLLAGELAHETYRTLADVREKSARYAELGARELHARGRRVTGSGAAARAAWAFVRCYLLRAGFLDGSAGLQLARMQAAVTWGKYSRLRRITR
jgi:glycosyltransferase involved in cell wall biosynthesis